MRKDSHIYLVKANNDLISHCRCAKALITFPPQLDCPWCGCGWLFSCMKCRKAFTFAKGVEINETWEETATKDLRKYWEKEPTKKDVRQWTAAMKDVLTDVEVGIEYVCLDGHVIPVDTTSVCFYGWHSHHDLAYLPQVAALDDDSIIEDVLSNRDYWLKTALPDKD